MSQLCRLSQMRRIQKEAFALFEMKNADYGDAFATYGAVGVIVRMGDKISRLSSISSTRVTLVNDESLRDTLLDLHNYSAMALMCLEDQDLSDEENNDGEEVDICEKDQADGSVSLPTESTDGIVSEKEKQEWLKKMRILAIAHGV